MIVQISKARPDDFEQLTDLLATLFTQEAEFAPNRESQLAALKTIVGNPQTGEITVARRDGRCIGMVLILYTISTALGGCVGILEDMIVAEDCRGQGVGRELITTAIERARDNGCQRVSLLTDSDNLNAQRFYRSHGFSHSSMTLMRLSLSPDSK